MDLSDLTPKMNSTQILRNIKSQFGDNISMSNLGLNESIELLNRSNDAIKEFKLSNKYQISETNASYHKMAMINEAVFKHTIELFEGLEMNKKLVTALKIAMKGGQLNESQLKKLGVSRKLYSVFESKENARAFMETYVAKKKMIKESEIDQAQTTMAAQDIADQIQSMIEKFADIKYKELPALHDSIRNSQGVEQAEQFNQALVSSLDSLTGNLESAKADVNNAIAVLTGEDVVSPVDNIDMGDEVEDDDIDLDLSIDDEEDDFEVDLEDDEGESEFGDDNLGRERR